MKVIRPGKLPEEKTYQGTCHHCECLFEFVRKEAEFESTCRNEDYLKVGCPTCKRLVYVQI